MNTAAGSALRVVPPVLAAFALVLALTPPSSASPAAHARAGGGKLLPTWAGYEVGTNPTAVATADFDGDGRIDVAYAHHSFVNNTITIQLNAGGGTMGKIRNYPAQDESTDIAAADLNGDGHADLVSTAEGLSDNGTIIDVYLNDGHGAFTHSTVTGGHGPSRLALGDLTGDGVPDVALANNGANDQGTTVGVLKGKGDGTFGAETTYAVGAGVFGIVAADLNGDGLLDLAAGRASNAEDAYHVVVLGNTGSTFKIKADVTIAGGPERFPTEPPVAAALINGDAKVDLVAGAGLFDQITVLRNTGNWSFSPTNWPASFGAVNLIGVDGNGDGHTDIVEASPFGGTQSTGELNYLQNRGDGAFDPPVIVNQGYLPNDVAAADVSGDGRDDLAVANEGSGTGSIDPQRKTGGFAGASLYQAEQGLLPKDTASADFDGDGRIDMAMSNIDISSRGLDRVDIMHNAGKGRMVLVDELLTGTDSNAKSVVAADLNGDGHPDLVWTPEIFAQPPTYPVAIAMNRGDGTFKATRLVFPQTCGTGHVSAIDVNGDGKLDLVVANDRGGPGVCDTLSRQIRILIGHGDGTFEPDYGVEIGTLSSMVAGADLNHDGIMDLVDTDAITHVLIGTGGGQFEPAVAYKARGNELSIADFNGDGAPDVATADGSLQHVWIMTNKGNGTFSQKSYPGEQIFGYLTGNAIAVADLDGDGRLDLAVSDFQGQDVGVFFGRGNGSFGPEVRYGVQYAFDDVNIADYNGDGRPDIGGPAAIGGALESQGDGVTILLNRSR